MSYAVVLMTSMSSERPVCVSTPTLLKTMPWAADGSLRPPRLFRERLTPVKLRMVSTGETILQDGTSTGSPSSDKVLPSSDFCICARELAASSRDRVWMAAGRVTPRPGNAKLLGEVLTTASVARSQQRMRAPSPTPARCCRGARY